MKHTPGPWKVEPAYYVGHDEGETEVSAYFPEFDKWCRIANCYDENVTLIAAAPELLEACKNALEWGESEIHSEYSGCSMFNKRLEELDFVRAAIAKAEGR